MEINKERLEAWLFSQPDERIWRYCDPWGCVACSFLKETTEFNDAEVGSDFWRQKRGGSELNPLPEFMLELLKKALGKSPSYEIEARSLKSIWKSMFPETQSPVAVKEDQTV